MQTLTPAHPDNRPAATKITDAFVELPPQRKLLEDMEEVYANSRAVCVITGPRSSGRRRLLRAFADELRPHSAVAIVDGSEADPRKVLSSMLAQLGYDFSSNVIREMGGMLRVFCVQQTEAGRRPFVAIVNADQMNIAVCRVINALARLQVSEDSTALSMAISGTERISRVLTRREIASLAGRIQHLCELEPLSADDLALYVNSKYGQQLLDAESALKLRKMTRGLPGNIDAVIHNATGDSRGVTTEALRTMLEATPTPELHAAPEEPQVEPHMLISQSGQLLSQEFFSRQRTLIGRGEHNDVILDSRYISRHHALIVHADDGTHWLVDLGSRNGSFVNSKTVGHWPLRDNDIISLGNHRLKYINPQARGPRPARSEFEHSATAVMRALESSGPELVKVIDRGRESTN